MTDAMVFIGTTESKQILKGVAGSAKARGLKKGKGKLLVRERDGLVDFVLVDPVKGQSPAHVIVRSGVRPLCDPGAQLLFNGPGWGTSTGAPVLNAKGPGGIAALVEDILERLDGSILPFMNQWSDPAAMATDPAAPVDAALREALDALGSEPAATVLWSRTIIGLAKGGAPPPIILPAVILGAKGETNMLLKRELRKAGLKFAWTRQDPLQSISQAALLLHLLGRGEEADQLCSFLEQYRFQGDINLWECVVNSLALAAERARERGDAQEMRRLDARLGIGMLDSRRDGAHRNHYLEQADRDEAAEYPVDAAYWLMIAYGETLTLRAAHRRDGLDEPPWLTELHATSERRLRAAL